MGKEEKRKWKEKRDEKTKRQYKKGRKGDKMGLKWIKEKGTNREKKGGKFWKFLKMIGGKFFKMNGTIYIPVI